MTFDNVLIFHQHIILQGYDPRVGELFPKERFKKIPFTLDISLISNYNTRMKNVNRIIALISNIRDKANKFIIAELEKNSIVGLVPSHGNILYTLYYAKDNLTMQDIAKKINRDKSTVTSLVKKLVKLGYIEKIKNVEDNRSTIITLTPKGWKLETVFNDVSEKLINSIYKGFSKSEQIVVIEALEKINKNI